MPVRKSDGPKFTGILRLRWILLALVVGVLILSIFAFISPVSQKKGDPSLSTGEVTSPTSPTPDDELQVTQTDEAEALPPTPEEIGYTDGIIFMSTLLILILLAATLRETLLRKRP